MAMAFPDSKVGRITKWWIPGGFLVPGPFQSESRCWWCSISFESRCKPICTPRVLLLKPMIIGRRMENSNPLTNCFRLPQPYQASDHMELSSWRATQVESSIGRIDPHSLDIFGWCDHSSPVNDEFEDKRLPNSHWDCKNPSCRGIPN